MAWTVSLSKRKCGFTRHGRHGCPSSAPYFLYYCDADVISLTDWPDLSSVLTILHVFYGDRFIAYVTARATRLICRVTRWRAAAGHSGRCTTEAIGRREASSLPLGRDSML